MQSGSFNGSWTYDVKYSEKTLKKKRVSHIDIRHHEKERETAVTIYTGLKLYSTVRSRTLIDHLFQLGLCISYDRILSITKSLYESLRETFHKHCIFLPGNLRKGCFVVSVKDNIDKNASVNLAPSHFHGTGISLLQPLDYENQGEFM